MLEKIKNVVEKESKVKDLCIRKNNREYVYLRMIYSKIARELTAEPLMAIGNVIKRDHSNIIHYLKNFDNYISYEPKLLEIYEKCRSIMYSQIDEYAVRLYIRNNLSKLDKKEINEIYNLIKSK